MPKRIEDLTGRVFTRLTVLAATRKNLRAAWECQCECGKVKTVLHNHLLSGATRSCGCLQKEAMSSKASAGGASMRPETRRAYNIYLHMLDRCHNTRSHNFARYGGRGITVCKEWQESFNAFIADMGLPEPSKTLDRIDNNSGYYKENCRWATPSQQNVNKRSTVSLTYDGRTQAVSEWAKELGLHPATISFRLRSKYFSGDEVLAMPPNRRNKRERYVSANGATKSIREWAEELGCSKQVILSRLFNGWDEERAVTEKPKKK